MVRIERSDNKPISFDQLHDITDVLMNALHTSFDGQTLDAGTLSGAFFLLGLGVLKDAQFDSIKQRAHDLIDGVGLEFIEPFQLQKA